MTTFANRPNTALLVVDVQVDAISHGWQRDEVIGHIAELVAAARADGVPVVWVQHSSDNMPIGSPGWEIVPELVPLEGERIVRKRYGDAFEDTELESVLAELGVGKLLVCGVDTAACIISTIFGAFVRGYDVTLVGDAHTTTDGTSYGMPEPQKVIDAVNLIWQYRSAPGRQAAVIDTESFEV